jgi:hypothetical protein
VRWKRKKLGRKAENLNIMEEIVIKGKKEI